LFAAALTIALATLDAVMPETTPAAVIEILSVCRVY